MRVYLGPFLFVGGICLVLSAAVPVAAQDKKQEKKKEPGFQADGLKNLRHPDANIRYQTAALIAKQGPRAKFAVEELREALQDTDPLVRVKVAEALWKVERPSPSVILPTLQRALKDKNPEVREAACEAIGMLGGKGKAAVPALTLALKDEKLPVVMAAVSALGDIGPSATEAAPALLQLAGYADFIILEPIVGAALGEMGEGAVPELAAALKEKSANRRRAAAYALGSMGPKAEGATKPLTGALGDEEWTIRSLAARALGNIGISAKLALPRLREATVDKNAQVRVRAAFAVWQIAADTKYVPLLSRSLEDEDVAARELACRALATMATDAKPASGALCKALGDKAPSVQQAAAQAIGSIGRSAKDCVVSLRPLLQDKDRTLRLHAAFALWQVTGEAKESLKALRPLLAEEDAVQVLAVEKIGAIGPAARDLLPDLVRAYREEDGEAIRRALGDAIKKIDPELAGKLGLR